jgi:hypothetical protein
MTQSIIQMGGNSVYTNTLGIKFNDGTTQITSSSGEFSTVVQIANGNTGSFYLPLLANPTAFDGALILDAPSGFIGLQADAGNGVGVGGSLSLQAANGPFGIAKFTLSDSAGDVIQADVSSGFQISSAGGPIQLTPGNSTSGVQVVANNSTNFTLLPLSDA